MKSSVELTLRKATSHQNKGEITQAIQLYESILNKFPKNNKARQAINTLKRQIRQDHPAQDRLNNMLALYKQGRLEETVNIAVELIRDYPELVTPYNILGNTFAKLNHLDAALETYKRALAIDPNHAELHNNLGVTHTKTGAWAAAAASFKRAAELMPDYIDAHSNLGVALIETGYLDEAIISLKRATQLMPKHAGAHNNLGIALKETGNFEAAVNSFKRVLELQPDNASALSQKIYLQEQMCVWEQQDDIQTAAKVFDQENSNAAPFTLLTIEDNPEKQHLRATNYARLNFTRTPLPGPNKPMQRPEKLRIGYFSADFHNHATMYLMARLFEEHDNNKFSIFAYSYGSDKNDEMRQRLIHSVDHFRDVRNMTDKEIAIQARQDNIDIAVDLKGYTYQSRTGIFTYRAAPIQINYLGYPGTMGNSFIDYIIADEIVIPADMQKYFSENIIYLPHSYQVNDSTREISERKLYRSEFNLPKTAFVFCCFNKNYKISPDEFDIWMRLLHKVQGSVLWLMRSNKQAEVNLIKEAVTRGIERERIVFADKLPHAEHLARLQLADLFLDTFKVNAHTTTSDALWAGLPVITKVGKSFAARVAASLLCATGMDELVTYSEEDYETLALELAINKDKLNAIKNKLAKNRKTYPLFNTELFVRHLEQAYIQIYQRYYDDSPLQAIRVKPLV